MAASHKLEWVDVAPFVAAIGLVLLSPLLDELLWRNSYREFYRGKDIGSQSLDNLTLAASWAVNIAQVLPGVILCWVGIVLISSSIGRGLALLSVVMSLLPFVVVGFMQRHRGLHKRPLRWLPPLVVLVVNALGVIL